MVADESSLESYGHLVADPQDCEIEIVPWPAQGWRPVDNGTGDQGGVVEGTFSCQWTGDVLMARNDAVNGHYVLGWRCDPQLAATETRSGPLDQVLLWHLNYQPRRWPAILSARTEALRRACGVAGR